MGYLMKQCKINENHWYSDHLPYCPWCKIAKETGKDPFPSPVRQQTSLKPKTKKPASLIQKPKVNVSSRQPRTRKLISKKRVLLSLLFLLFISYLVIEPESNNNQENSQLNSLVDREIEDSAVSFASAPKEEVQNAYVDSIGMDNGPLEEWSKTFGGEKDDDANSVKQTSDGGYIIVGSTESYGDCIYVVKTDKNGNQQWNKTFEFGDISWASSVEKTSDDEYVIVGQVWPDGSDSNDIILIKIDASGKEEWHSIFGGTKCDWAYSVQQTSDSGYIIAGEYSYDVDRGDALLIKTDENGKVKWRKQFGSGDETSMSVQQTSDGGYILEGIARYENGDGDPWIMKTDSNGNKQWIKRFGGTKFDSFGCVRQTSGGGYIISGGTNSYGAGGFDAWLIKTDQNGNEQWSRTFGGKRDDYAHSVQQSSDGGYVLAGRTASFGSGDADGMLIKTDSNGNMQWSKLFGGKDTDWIFSMQQTSDGGYILAGQTLSFGSGSWDAWIVKVPCNNIE